METLICHKWGAIKESQVLGFFWDDKEKLFIRIKEMSYPQYITPYPEDELMQSIRDGKLNPRDLGKFDCSDLSPLNNITPIEHDISPSCTLPFLLFLVRDNQDNIKLRNANSLNGRSNFVAFLGNPRLYPVDEEKDFGRPIPYVPRFP